jgi:cobalt-precorrin 5A hydrolase / precorrin-3B C17-methyltransferase
MSNLWVGIGYQQGVSAIAIEQVIDRVFTDFWLDRELVAGVGTIDRKATDSVLVQICQCRGWQLQFFAATVLTLVTVPQASPRIFEQVGTPTVAEGAALLSAGGGSQLLVPKRIYGQAGQAITIAVAQTADPDKISCC